MNHAKRALVFIAISALLIGCARLKGNTRGQVQLPQTTAELQDINLNSLYGIIENLELEIAAIKKVPGTKYPLYEQLRATDLAGMEARKELMLILVEHCQFAKKELLEADKHPERKQQILEAWAKHKERMAALLDAADKKVNALERKRIRLEFDLIEATLQHKLGGNHGPKSK